MVCEVAETGYNPWRDLRGRTDIWLRFAALPGPFHGAYGRRGDRAAIVINSRLGRRQRNAVLAHELIHDERGGGCDAPGMPDSWQPVVARDEAAVDDEVARRLVPLDELGSFCRAEVTLGHGVSASDVAEYFDVPEEVAARAVKLWLRA